MLLPDTLVISGGGVRCAAALGAAHALRGASGGKLLRETTCFVGTSAGAIVAACLAVRADPVGVMRQIEARPFVPHVSVANFGVDSGAHLVEWIRVALGNDADSTFAAVRARHNTTLVVCATELRTRRAEYFSADSHPDMSVALSLRMSCSIPLAFAAVRHAGGVYVDGALCDNFPMAWARTRSSRVLGIRFTPRPPPADIRTPQDFLAAICECATATPQPAAVPSRDVLSLTVPPSIRSTDMGAANSRTLRRLFNSGAAQARAYVKKNV